MICIKKIGAKAFLNTIFSSKKVWGSVQNVSWLSAGGGGLTKVSLEFPSFPVDILDIHPSPIYNYK